MASTATMTALFITLLMALFLAGKKTREELREKQVVIPENPIPLRTVKHVIPKELPLSVREYVEELFQRTGDEHVWNLLPPRENEVPGEFHPDRFYPPGDRIGVKT
ncbi:uncharacterized protein EI90DRAFT_3021224 [Cantharellus anzutake]|uniref:uncharacterized protein n=1 Tax=Cantharellus anzutake TaxID=1750568 RepID=UPI001905B0F0|nr:uncharacterized protein EI90DRAFT_3021224 [Cantharellus anzutake]KAF8318071.1 hypothetical protein EI90DRAFT_3021224 [Cantharellus anzutake]